MTLSRFTGTVEYLADVDVRAAQEWVAGIDYAEWPNYVPDAPWQGFVKDEQWHGFLDVVSSIIWELHEHLPSRMVNNLLLSAVAPGYTIPPHTDEQGERWLCRVHVPLVVSEDSRFEVGGEAHRMEVGKAYRVNTEVEHSVTNDGTTPRIHFMFDVLEA